MAKGDSDIWYGTVDNGQWECRVEGDPDERYRGRLKVNNTTSGEVILDDQVTLAYGAMFGPDVADVAEWQERCITAIDANQGDTDGQ